MKKMILFFALITCGTSVCIDGSKVVTSKAGYVSSMAVINESKMGKKIREEVDTMVKSSTMEIQKREQDMTKAMNDYKLAESNMKDEAREREQARIMKMRRDYDGVVQEKEEEFKRLQQKYNDQLTKEAVQVAAEVGKAAGLDTVIDSDSGRVLYVASTCDYSAEFTAAMNKRFDMQLEKKAEPAKKTAAA